MGHCWSLHGSRCGRFHSLTVLASLTVHGFYASSTSTCSGLGWQVPAVSLQESRSLELSDRCLTAVLRFSLDPVSGSGQSRSSTMTGRNSCRLADSVVVILGVKKQKCETFQQTHQPDEHGSHPSCSHVGMRRAVQFSPGSFSLNLWDAFSQPPRCFTGTSLLPFRLFLRPILKCWSVGAALMRFTWANHSERRILVSNVSVTFHGFRKSSTSDWLPYV